MKKFDFDFLIIGSGLAGLFTAQLASKYGTVAILSKTTSDVSNSYLAQGGIAAAVDPEDSPANHFNDTIKAGRDLCNQEAVKILVEEAKSRIDDLIEMGMYFDEVQGELALGLEGGHNKRRVLHAGGDATGKKLVEFLTNLVKKNPKISWLENTLVYRLLTKDDICYGAYAYNYDFKKDYVFIAKNTILATGGAGGVYKRTTNPFTSIGDGVNLAYNANAKIESMEFIQFHPTAFYSGGCGTFLISEAVRGEGAYMLNHNGERFMLQHHELAELAPRDIVSSAIHNELKKNNYKNVYLSLKHLDAQKIKIRFSSIYKEAKKYGIDITTDLVPVAPAAHYMIGGIKTNLYAETNIKRLYAIGEVASTGIHGANRLASNSLLECLVFGKRVVDHSKNNLDSFDFDSDILKMRNLKANDSKKEITDNLLNEIAEIMNMNVGLVRNEIELNEALTKLYSIEQNFEFEENEYFSLKLRSVLNVCALITKSALLRKESRGGHVREDYPSNSNDFLNTIVMQKNMENLYYPIK